MKPIIFIRNCFLILLLCLFSMTGVYTTEDDSTDEWIEDPEGGIIAGDGLFTDPIEPVFQSREFAPRAEIKGDIIINGINVRNDKQLFGLYQLHGIHDMPMGVRELFVNRYLMTRWNKYRPKGNLSYCTTYYYDYFNSRGYSDIIEGIKASAGKTMIHKALNYANKNKKVTILYNAFEAQKLANKGREIGIIGEYYYDSAERYFTRHYGIVQPSLATFDQKGNILSYPISGCISNRSGINGKMGSGMVVVQAGTVNGMIDFRWSYNKKTGGIIQRDSSGNIKGGIVFVVFPGKEIADEKPTARPTQAPTKAPTQPPTNPPTQPPTNPPTQAPTEPPTEKPAGVIGDAIILEPPKNK